MLMALIVVLGLIIGSFLNVVIYRLPRGKTFVGGRSHCPHCSRAIAWYDLLPVASYVVLAGKCRRCRRAISWRYPFVEIYSALVFVFSFKYFAAAGLAHWLFWLFLLELFLVLAIIDLEQYILPDSLMVIAAAGVAFYDLAGRSIPSNGLVAAGGAFTIFFLIWLASKGKWLGLGDAKLAALIGFIFGLAGAVAILYLAIVFGAITGLILLVSGRAKLGTRLPLGTFIGFTASLFIFTGPFLERRIYGIFHFVPYILK